MLSPPPHGPRVRRQRGIVCEAVQRSGNGVPVAAAVNGVQHNGRSEITPDANCKYSQPNCVVSKSSSAESTTIPAGISTANGTDDQCDPESAERNNANPSFL